MKRIILSAFLIIGLNLCLISLSGCGPSTTNSAGVESTKPEEYYNSKVDSEAIESDISTLNQSGDLRYSGKSSAENIESISVSFALSEDKNSIHDFTIFINGFHGTAKISGSTVSVDVTGQTQTIMNEIPVNYDGDNRKIAVGDSTIESLHFNEDGTADLIFTYRVKQTTPQPYEISVSGIQFELISKSIP